ncbi:Acyl-CoA dehydrogenase; probable dibenzothiophene desulfurization enzyme [plant metagenome]|uniref:Acyl-CoA dehydrogenase probable dibenzothiophene desulfurization enzyme n=1 Tax=plant metagenome TaxID=1297885 RepID=A0A484QXM8_9ZZZZ
MSHAQAVHRRLSAAPSDPDDAPQADALVLAAQALAEALASASAHRDAQRALPHAPFQRLRAERIGALRVPREHGGAGGSVVQMVDVALALARGDSNVAQAFLSHFVFLERLRLMGTPAQQARYLPQAARGTLFGAAAAERGGKTRGELATRLVRDGDHYRLDGLKHYSTGALFADVLKIRALDDEGRMVAAMIPADREGVTRIDDWDGMGQRCTASGTTRLARVRVEADEILLMQPWLAQRHHTGALAQIFHCAVDAGIAQAALRDAVDWGRRGLRAVKESGVARPQDDPYVLQTVGGIAAQAAAAEAMVRAAAARIDAAADARFGTASPEDIERLTVDASIATAQAKIISTRASLHAGQALFDVGGAATTLRGHNFDRHWRNARTHTTHDPLAYKFRTVGDYLLNDQAPPLTFSY